MRADATRGVNWLERFEAKSGMGACICEGQEIAAVLAEVARLRDWRNDAAGVMAQFIHLSSRPDEQEWGEAAAHAAWLLNAAPNAKPTGRPEAGPSGAEGSAAKPGEQDAN